MLGCVTDDGETFFLPCEDDFIGDITVRLLDALRTEFGEKLCIVLDNTTYFTTNAVMEFAEDTALTALNDIEPLNTTTLNHRISIRICVHECSTV